MNSRVVHCKRKPYDIYIGRPGPWGNPFEIGADGDRDLVIEKFRVWLADGLTFGNQRATPEARQKIMKNIKTLRGKTLGCWCAPLACHGDVLLEFAEAEE